jgi:hypothetical protein
MISEATYWTPIRISPASVRVGWLAAHLLAMKRGWHCGLLIGLRKSLTRGITTTGGPGGEGDGKTGGTGFGECGRPVNDNGSGRFWGLAGGWGPSATLGGTITSRGPCRVRAQHPASLAHFQVRQDFRQGFRQPNGGHVADLPLGCRLPGSKRPLARALPASLSHRRAGSGP